MTPHASTFIILDSAESTNNYAMAQVHAGLAEHGKAWFTADQTHGKGRRGRHWEMQKNKSIALSIIVDTEFLPIYRQFELSVAAALGCYDLFSKYAGDDTKIKWPNDLYWNDRKAGGILIENVIMGNEWKWSVIGIGININQTEFSNPAIRP